MNKYCKRKKSLPYFPLILRGGMESIKFGTAILLLGTVVFINTSLAQTCTVPPTCESLGFDKTAEECVDKAILKCPLDASKIFCSNGIADGVSPTPGYGGGTGANGSYQIGDVLTCNGKSVGYVIEVSSDGASGRVSSLDYEDNGTTYDKTTGNTYCKAKTACNLSWELVRNSTEIGEICLAKKVSISNMWSQSESYRYYANYSDCKSSVSDYTNKNPSKIFCTAAFVTDKSSGGATPTSYKIGDTYSVNGVAMGKVVEVDSTGQHGVLAISGGTATASQASTNCSSKTAGGLNWGMATGRHACKIIGDTSVGSCDVTSSSGNGYCFNGSINTSNKCTETSLKAYVCEAPF